MKKYLVLTLFSAATFAHAQICDGGCMNAESKYRDGSFLISDSGKSKNCPADSSAHQHQEIPYGAATGYFGGDGVFVFTSFNQEIFDDLALNKRINDPDKAWLRSTWVLQQRLKVADDWIQLMLDEKRKNIQKGKK